MSSISLKVLSYQSIQTLTARGEAGIQGGYRQVSNTSYATSDSLDSETTVLIPDELDSEETLHFLELNNSTASIVWQQFLDRQQELPDRADVLNSTKRYVAGIEGDAIDDDDANWIEIMRRIGLTSNFQARIMQEDMKDMRLSGSLKHWVLEMMEMRYDFLKTLDRVLQAPPTTTLGRKSIKPAIGGSFSTKSAPPVPPRLSRKAGKGPELGTFKPASPNPATTSEDPPKQMDGHTMLFKGAARTRLDNMFLANAVLNFGAIRSTPLEIFQTALVFTSRRTLR